MSTSAAPVKQGTTEASASTAPSTETAGMFDHLPPAEQATKDAATVEAEEESKTETSTDTETTDGQPDQTEGEDGKEEGRTEEGPETTKEEIIINGRTYKSVEELAKVHQNSSDEGVRLNHALNTVNQENQSLKSRLVELEDQIGSAPYPKTLTKEQLESMTQAEQTQYILDKRDWDQNQAKAKEQREKTRTELKAYQEDLKATIADNIQRLESQPQKYPGFKDTEEIRTAILRRTPWLNNWPETPYITWLIAKGLDSLSKNEAMTTEENKATDKASRTAEAAAASSKGGRASTSKGNTGEPASPLVSAYRARTGVF